MNILKNINMALKKSNEIAGSGWAAEPLIGVKAISRHPVGGLCTMTIVALTLFGAIIYPVKRAYASEELDALKVDAYISRMADPLGDGITNINKMILKAGVKERALIYDGLIKHIDTDQNVDVRRGCVLSLARYGNVSSRELCKALNYDQDRSVRKAAAMILGYVGTEKELDELYKACVKDKGIYGSRGDIATEAVVAMGNIGGEKASDLLVKLWREGLYNEALISSIGAAGNPKGIDALEEILNSKDPLIRKNAAYGLVEMTKHNINNPAVVNRIDNIFRKYASDPDSRVRENITRVYGLIGTIDDIPALKKLLTDDSKTTVSYVENGREKRKIVYPVREQAKDAIKFIKFRHEQLEKNDNKPSESELR